MIVQFRSFNNDAESGANVHTPQESRKKGRGILAEFDHQKKKKKGFGIVVYYNFAYCFFYDEVSSSVWLRQRESVREIVIDEEAAGTTKPLGQKRTRTGTTHTMLAVGFFFLALFSSALSVHYRQ